MGRIREGVKMCGYIFYPKSENNNIEYICRVQETDGETRILLKERIVRCELCSWHEDYNDEYMRCKYPFPMTEQGMMVKPGDYCCHGQNPVLGVVKINQ